MPAVRTIKKWCCGKGLMHKAMITSVVIFLCFVALMIVWIVSRGVSAGNLYGVWVARPQVRFDPRSMEANLHNQFRLSIFGDGKYEKKIVSVSKGTWTYSNYTLVLKDLERVDWDPDTVRTERYMYDPNMKMLVFSKDTNLKLERTSTTPVHLKEGITR